MTLYKNCGRPTLNDHKIRRYVFISQIKDEGHSFITFL